VLAAPGSQARLTEARLVGAVSFVQLKTDSAVPMVATVVEVTLYRGEHAFGVPVLSAQLCASLLAVGGELSESIRLHLYRLDFGDLAVYGVSNGSQGL
jgi:hypothetical protein